MGLQAILPFLQQFAQQAQQAPPPDLTQAQPPAPAQTPAPAQPAMPAQSPMVTPPAPAPEQTKAHKLLQILQGGLVGGLSGLAANAQTYAQTGRNAGFGGGVGAGFTQSLPMQAQQQQQQLAQSKAQTKLTQQQSDMVQTPYGMLPATLAKAIFGPAIAAQAKVQSAQIGATSKENVAQTQAQTQEKIHRFIPVQGVGLFDSQTRQAIPETEQGITITPEIAADHNLPDQFIGKPMSLQQLAAVQRSDVFANVPQMTAQGPIVVNRKTSTATPVTGPGGQKYSPPALATPQEIVNPDDTSQTKFVSKGQAIASGAAGPQSSSLQVSRLGAKAEMPTKIGDQKVAFTTMIQHADLLRRAAKALNNGDMQTLNGLESAFKNEFGYSGPITSSAIADAYKGEVSNVINKGHITDTGNEKIAHTLEPTKQNYQQIDDVLGAYQSLAQSKMNMLAQQQKSAVQKSQLKKPNQPNSNKPNDSLGIR